MQQRIIIIGAGFAGMYAALPAARLRDIAGVSPARLEIALVAPEPRLVIRPRLYEPKPETLTAPLRGVLDAVDVIYAQGRVEKIDAQARSISVADFPVRGDVRGAGGEPQRLLCVGEPSGNCARRVRLRPLRDICAAHAASRGRYDSPRVHAKLRCRSLRRTSCPFDLTRRRHERIDVTL